MSLDNFYDEAAQQQPTEYRPIRLSDGSSYPDLFSLDRIKVTEVENLQYGYYFGTSASSVVFTSGQVILSVAVVNTSNNQVGTFSINGGDSVLIDGGESFELTFTKGSLVGGTITFSGNLKWFVDWLN